MSTGLPAVSRWFSQEVTLHWQQCSFNSSKKKSCVLNFIFQGKENTKRTLELVRKVGEVLSSTSHSSQGKTVVKSNFVDVAIYKEKPEDLSGRNISEGGADIVIPDSNNIFPKTNGSVTLQVNRPFDWTIALSLLVLF